MGISKEKKPTATTDWSKAMVESTLKRFPTAQDSRLMGLCEIFVPLRQLPGLATDTVIQRYLQYIKDWVDSHVDSEGNFFNTDKEGKTN